MPVLYPEFFKNKEIVLLFGSDIEILSLDSILSLNPRESIFIPLDPEALHFYTKHKIDFITFDDVFGDDHMMKIIEKANYLQQFWTQSHSHFFDLNGINLSLFEEYPLRYFWKDFLLLRDFAHKMNQYGALQITTMVSNQDRPHIYYYKSDIAKKSLSKLFHGKVNYLVDERPIKKQFNTPTYSIPANIETQGKIVFAVNPHELHRFQNIMEDVNNVFNPQVIAISVHPANEFLKQNQKDYILPTLGVQIVQIPNNGLQNIQLHYQNAINELLKDEIAISESLYAVQDEFSYLAQHRWPCLYHNLAQWVDKFKVSTPKCVLVSSLPDLESQLPAIAADLLGIPLYIIPHGGGGLASHLQLKSAKVLYGMYNQKKRTEFFQTHPDNIIGARGLLAKTEHKPSEELYSFPKDKLNVLLLTDPISNTDTIFPYTSYNAQITSFDTIFHIAKQFQNQINFYVKPHPMGSDAPFLVKYESSKVFTSLDPNANLHDIIEQCDCILSVNSINSAMIHSIRSKKPIVSWITDPYILNSLDPKFDSKHMIHFCRVFSDAKMLSLFFEKILEDKELLDIINKENHLIAAKYFDDSHYPSVSEILVQRLQVIQNLPDYQLASFLSDSANKIDLEDLLKLQSKMIHCRDTNTLKHYIARLTEHKDQDSEANQLILMCEHALKRIEKLSQDESKRL